MVMTHRGRADTTATETEQHIEVLLALLAISHTDAPVIDEYLHVDL